MICQYTIPFPTAGNTVSGGFHGNCGNPVLKKTSGYPKYAFFHAAAPDDPHTCAPQRVVYSRSKQPLDYVDPSLPCRREFGLRGGILSATKATMPCLTPRKIRSPIKKKRICVFFPAVAWRWLLVKNRMPNESLQGWLGVYVRPLLNQGSRLRGPNLRTLCRLNLWSTRRGHSVI